MVGSLGRFGDGNHEINSRHEGPELIGLRDHFTAAAPALQAAEVTLDRNVG